MSDHAQTIVTIDVAEGCAEDVGRRVTDFLIVHEFVQPVLADCVLGGMGYPPGPRSSEVVDGPFPQTHGLRINGVSVMVGRNVFDTGANGLEVRCAACGMTFEPGDAYAQAVGAWFEGDGDVSYTCDECGVARVLRAWEGDWAWAVGFLGVKFWNWPPLRGEFLDEVAAIAGGRVRLVRSRV